MKSRRPAPCPIPSLFLSYSFSRAKESKNGLNMNMLLIHSYRWTWRSQPPRGDPVEIFWHIGIKKRKKNGFGLKFRSFVNVSPPFLSTLRPGKAKSAREHPEPAGTGVTWAGVGWVLPPPFQSRAHHWSVVLRT